MAKLSGKCQRKRIPVKEKNWVLLVSFLSDPDNPFPNRQDYSQTILKYKNPTQIYRYFTPEELTQIEAEAMENRKARTARQRAKLYDKLYELGDDGNVTAIKEYLDRTEGKVKEKIETTVDGELVIKWQS